MTEPMPDIEAIARGIAFHESSTWWNSLTDGQRHWLAKDPPALGEEAFLAGVRAGLSAKGPTTDARQTDRQRTSMTIDSGLIEPADLEELLDVLETWLASQSRGFNANALRAAIARIAELEAEEARLRAVLAKLAQAYVGASVGPQDTAEDVSRRPLMREVAAALATATEGDHGY